MRFKHDSRFAFATRLLIAFSALLVVGIAVMVVLIVWNRLSSPPAAAKRIVADSAEAYDGIIKIDPPLDLPDFTLTDQLGEKLSLSDLRGRYVLLTFGYTHCPDVCPLTLNEFRRIRLALDDLQDNVAFVFISVDGARDTAPVIQGYFARRELDGIIGLTGDEATLRALGADYGLSFEIVEGRSRGAYLVNHTAGSFLLDPNGRWIRRYQFGVAPSAIVSQLKVLIAT